MGGSILGAPCCHLPGLLRTALWEKSTQLRNHPGNPKKGRIRLKEKCLDNLREKETEAEACSWHVHGLLYLSFQTT